MALERWAELNVARQRELRCDGGCGLGSPVGELAETDAETRADLAAGFTRWEALLRDGLQATRPRRPAPRRVRCCLPVRRAAFHRLGGRRSVVGQPAFIFQPGLMQPLIRVVQYSCRIAQHVPPESGRLPSGTVVVSCDRR